MTPLLARTAISDLLTNLFSKDQKRLDHELEGLIAANHEAGNPKEGFLLNGEFFTRVPLTSQSQAMKKMIHPSLRPAGMEFVARRKRLSQEKIRIEAGLNMLLQTASTNQDIRDALPEIVVDLVPAARGLSRTRPEGFTLQHNPMHLHDYQRTAELLAYYAVNQLLY